MANKPRQPSPTKASRAGKDMHSSNPQVRKEAAEVMAVIPRKPASKKK
jgi:hypothetical protein